MWYHMGSSVNNCRSLDFNYYFWQFLYLDKDTKYLQIHDPWFGKEAHKELKITLF